MKGQIVLAVGALLIVIGGFAYERMLWNECRRDHGFFYCMRVLYK